MTLFFKPSMMVLILLLQVSCASESVARAGIPTAPQCCQHGAVTTCLPGGAEWFRDSEGRDLTLEPVIVAWRP